MGRYRLVEHTADMGIEASGESREELFAQAAYGLREVLFGTVDSASREERTLTVTGADSEELLVNWLSEVLYLVDSQRFLPTDFEVEEIGGGTLKARIMGEPIAPGRHHQEREVKAVTYHQLQVEKLDGRWQATVYLDL